MYNNTLAPHEEIIMRYQIEGNIINFKKASAAGNQATDPDLKAFLDTKSKGTQMNITELHNTLKQLTNR